MEERRVRHTNDKGKERREEVNKERMWEVMVGRRTRVCSTSLEGGKVEEEKVGEGGGGGKRGD